MGRWDDKRLSGTHPVIGPRWYWRFWGWSPSLTSRLHDAFEGSLRSWIEKKRRRNNMRGDVTLKTLAYDIHHRCVWLIDPVEAPLSKHVGKYRYHVTGLINLYPGSLGQLMYLREVQKYSHTPGTQKTIRRNNFIHIYLLYRLCQHQ